jgi:hypothetical protein
MDLVQYYYIIIGQVGVQRGHDIHMKAIQLTHYRKEES